MTRKISHFINGKMVAGESNRFADVYSPSLGNVIAQVPLASKSETEKAIQSAKDAFPAWSETPPLRRARILFKYKELLEKDMSNLKRLISEEHGKVLADSEGGVTRGMEVVEFACGIPHLLKGEFSENVGRNVDSHSIRQPLGVVAGITPFNFPAMVPMWMYPIALACGNTFVLKPSEKDPSSTLRMVELLHEAGLPDGVLNLINGDKEAVDTILTSPDIEAVSFVGSTPIAEYIYSTGSAHGKRVQALGGAKNHMVVMPDADFDLAADALMGAAYGSAGERCMAISVAVVVGDETGDQLIEKLSSRIDDLQVLASDHPNADMGPLVTKQHLDKVLNYVNIGIEEGAELIKDGRNVSVAGHEDGFFMGACLFDHVKPSMRVYAEEIFGPVLCVVRVPDYESALQLVNDHEFGNGTCIFTRDGDSARNFSSKVKVGMIGVNIPIPVPMAFHSFGGWKRSLFGDHSVHGTEGVHFYTRLKTITSRWPTGIRSGAQFTMPTM